MRCSSRPRPDSDCSGMGGVRSGNRYQIYGRHYQASEAKVLNMTSIKSLIGRRAHGRHDPLGGTWVLISVLCFLGGAGLKTESAIHQYGQLLMVTSVLGLLIMTAAVGAVVALKSKTR